MTFLKISPSQMINLSFVFIITNDYLFWFWFYVLYYAFTLLVREFINVVFCFISFGLGLGILFRLFRDIDFIIRV